MMKIENISEPSVHTRERIEYIDIFRCFGIIAMVMGHVGFGGKFAHLIHAFHMPMFFWISGFLFKHKSKEEISFVAFAAKKAKALLLPYFFFGIAHWLVSDGSNIFVDHVIPTSSLIHLFTDNTEGLAICGALWFLTALFFADIIFFLIDRYVLNKALKTIIIILITLIGHFETTIFLHHLPWALGQSFVGLGWFYIGFLFGKYRNQNVLKFIMNMSWVPVIILGAATVILIFMNGYIDMRTRQYAFIPLFWINSTLSIIVGVNIAKLIFISIKNTFVCDYLTGIGRDSIVYVCLNQFVILYCGKIIKMLGMPKVLQKIVILIVTLFVLRIIDKIIFSTPLKKIVGK